MTENEWAECRNTNAMFAAMQQPSESQLAVFNLICCRRIRSLISDERTLQALDALEQSDDHATISAEIALAANRVCESTAELYDPARNFRAARAVAHAVCRSLPPGSFYYWSDPLDNARLVALKCQSAVAYSVDAGTVDDGCNEADDELESGVGWLRDRAQEAEAAAQCDLIRTLFTRRLD